MNFNFELILFYAVLIAGVISLIDILFFARHRKKDVKPMWVIDYARSFFPVLLLVFLLRSFLFEPFRIPSGSLEPTLLIGDFILVNKYDYGVRLPVAHQKIVDLHQPQRGDIMVFRYPANPSVDFIKRVIGLPGDHISYINKELTINGKKIPQTFLQNTQEFDGDNTTNDVKEYREDLLGVQHSIFVNPKRQSADFKDIVVPTGMYFVMGDNRDDSQDSRYWGFVPEKNIVGKAKMIWLSWDSSKTNMRWDRIGTIIH